MKKLLFIVVLFLSLTSLNAQEFHFGAKLGGSYSAMKITGEDSEFNKYSNGKPNLEIGLISEYKLSDQFAIAPELIYAGSGDIYEIKIGNISTTLKFFFSYINLPVMARYYINDNLSFEAGPQLGILTSAVGEVKVTNNGETETKSEDLKDYYKGTNFSMNVGASYKLENGLFFNLRYNLGLSDIDKDDNTTTKISAFHLGIGYFFK